MQHSIEFALATTTDIPLLVDYRMRFLDELATQKPDANASQTVRGSIEQYLLKAMNDGTYLCWLAKENGVVIAIGGLVIREQPANYGCPNGRTGYILNMYTQPDYRRTGVGAAILEHIIQSAREADLSLLDLHATFKGESIYRQYGFTGPGSPVLEMKLK